MATPKTRETLKDGYLVPELSQAQNQCDENLELAPGLFSLSEKCTGLVSGLEVGASQNCDGVNFSINNIQVGNMDFTNRLILGEAGKESLVYTPTMNGESLESDSKGKRVVVTHNNGMRINDVSNEEVVSEVSGSEEVRVEEVMMDKHVNDGIASQFHGDDSAKKIKVSGDGISLFVDVFGPLNGIFEGDSANPMGDHVFNRSESDRGIEYEGSGQLVAGNGASTIAKSLEIREGVLDVTKNSTIVGDAKEGDEVEGGAILFQSVTFLAIIKDLAQNVSKPSMIELASIQNRLSTFYHSIGHCQLPMHQLRPTADTKDSVRDGLKSEKKDENLIRFSRGDRDTGLPKRGSGVTKERITSSDTAIGSKKRDWSGSVDGEDIDGCKMAACEVEMTRTSISSKLMEGRASSTGNCDEWIEGRSDKNHASRERKRSKYLSPPFVNSSWGWKTAPTSGEHKKEDIKEAPHVGVGSSAMVECRVKKSRKKQSRKPINGQDVSNKPAEINATSAELLSELRFMAEDCLYPTKSGYFNFVNRFFSEFRQFTFHEEFNNETGPLAANGESMLKKRRKKVKATADLPQSEIVSELPDLNGSIGLSVADRQIAGPVASQAKLQPKKRKKSDGAASENAKNKCAKLAPYLKDVEVGVFSLHSGAELSSSRERIHEAASSCPNNVLPAGQLDVNGSNAELSSLVVDSRQTGLPSADGKPERKKRKRKEKASDSLMTNVTPAIPDLNGIFAEASSMDKDLDKDLPDTNSIPPEGNPSRKRRRRNKAAVGMQVINVNYKEVLTNGEALGTALLLNFAPEPPLPSKEFLVATFCRFGQLKESETQVLTNGRAQVVFARSSDAADAFQSLGKGSAFGPALVSYRLHHLSPSIVSHQPVQPMDRLNTPTKPSGLIPPHLGAAPDLSAAGAQPIQPTNKFKTPPRTSGLIPPPQGEAPDLLFIRKNLEYMTSMLEKAGDSLSPEMRAKLESEVKGLLGKVTSMVGSASSS